MDPKQSAAEKAVEQVKDGMTVGLGTGSTSRYAIAAIGNRIRKGLRIRALASSLASEELARQSGIEVSDFKKINSIDLYIDGADEVDDDLNLIKGGGGALTREKILASNSSRFVVIVDENKLVKNLGEFPLPVELVPFAYPFALARLEKLGCRPAIRGGTENPFRTDNGNLIADCQFHTIADPAALHRSIRLIPGVVECGIFESSLVDSIIIGQKHGGTEEKKNSREL